MNSQILIIGATGKVGSRIIDELSNEKKIEIAAAAHSPQRAASSIDREIATAILDLDEEAHICPSYKAFTLCSF